MGFSFKGIFSFRRKGLPDPNTPTRGFSIMAGISINEETAMKVSAFHRGSIYIATQVAKLPWYIKDKKNEIQEDNISTLLNVAPNEEMTAMSFRIWAILTAILKGNAYAEIERDTLGRVIALWPIVDYHVDLVRQRETGKLYYRINGGAKDGSDAILEPKNIFHIPNFHTKDGIVGQGIVAYAIETLGISLGADRMAKNLFKNGGLPSGIIKHKGVLSDEAHERMKQSWKEQHSGDNSSGVAILEEDAQFEAINMDPQMLQFLESRKFGVLEICRFLGLPPSKLFDMSSATFSNVENANLEVATDTLDAWVCRLEQEVDVKLLNKRFAGRYSELDLYSVFRGDMSSRSSYFKNMMAVGAMTPNQVREREGLAPYPEGDRYYIATNNFTPADMIDDVIEAQIKKGESGSAPKEDPKKKEELQNAALSYLTRK